ncbi:USP domain-containing protein [Forsythia ovata]|uniref:USP domain-containing protein n=1 Tax=Forsythia ovata TaxID=205694 RepID=A0ABD1VL90_9LAMI
MPAGWTTTLIDMPLNSFPSTVSEETLKLKSFMCPSGINDFPMTNSSHIKGTSSVRELLTVMKDTRTGGPAEGAHLHIVHLADARSSLELIKIPHSLKIRGLIDFSVKSEYPVDPLWNYVVLAVFGVLWLERNANISEGMVMNFEFLWKRIVYWAALQMPSNREFIGRCPIFLYFRKLV